LRADIYLGAPGGAGLGVVHDDPVAVAEIGPGGPRGAAEAETKSPQLKAVGVTEPTFHVPPRLGRVASKVPVWLLGALLRTAFYSARDYR
jgi:hypothetical protein